MVVLFPAALSFEISSSFFASSALSSRKELALMALDFALVVGAMARYGIKVTQCPADSINLITHPCDLAVHQHHPVNSFC